MCQFATLSYYPRAMYFAKLYHVVYEFFSGSSAWRFVFHSAAQRKTQDAFRWNISRTRIVFMEYQLILAYDIYLCAWIWTVQPWNELAITMFPIIKLVGPTMPTSWGPSVYSRLRYQIWMKLRQPFVWNKYEEFLLKYRTVGEPKLYWHG